MKVFIIIAALASIVASSVIVTDEQGSIQEEFHHILTVDGKAYATEMQMKRDWKSAGDACRTGNYQLASITSTAQWNALKDAPLLNFQGEYWLSGRDAKALRQFSWNETNAQPGAYFTMSYYPTNYLTCMTIRKETGSFLIGAVPCTENHFTLCQA